MRHRLASQRPVAVGCGVLVGVLGAVLGAAAGEGEDHVEHLEGGDHLGDGEEERRRAQQRDRHEPQLLPGVRAALKAHHELRLRGQEIGDLSLALVAPLRP